MFAVLHCARKQKTEAARPTEKRKEKENRKMKKAIAMITTLLMMLGIGTTAFAVNAPLTADQATQAALNFAGVNPTDATITKAFKSYDDGREVFEIEFYVNGTEYDMDVDVNSGRITDFSTEFHGAPVAPTAPAAPGYGYWDDDMYERDYGWDDWDDQWDHDWDDRWDFD